MYPEREVYCNIKSMDFQEVFKGCIQGFTRNVKIIDDKEAENINMASVNTFIVTDTGNVSSEITPMLRLSSFNQLIDYKEFYI